MQCHNARGSSSHLLDGNGATLSGFTRFDAYGQRVGSGPQQHLTDYQFAGAHGYQREPAGGAELDLDYLYQRYYDPAIGRFISRDPIGYGGGLNLYGYCEGDPVNLVDPSGLDPSSKKGASTGIDFRSMKWLGSTVRFLIGVVDPGVADIAEVLTGTEAFTHNRLTPSERALTGVMLAIPSVPTNAVRSLLKLGSRACSRKLANNLIRAGIARPIDTAAHHIVAGSDKRGARSRQILASFGIDINSADNGVFLPTKQNTANKGAYHRSVHTNAYHAEVELLLKRATSKEEALDILAEIRSKLTTDGFAK